jgi:predicted RNA binding protein YcfA (HicA-like mRNA interferase family)
LPWEINTFGVDRLVGVQDYPLLINDLATIAYEGVTPKEMSRRWSPLAIVCIGVYSQAMKSADLIKELKAKGFAVVSVRGSHHKLRNDAGVTVIVPHPKKDLGIGLVAAIRKKAGL